MGSGVAFSLMALGAFLAGMGHFIIGPIIILAALSLHKTKDNSND